jgi:cobalt-zinc-cadmium efflux system protein
MGKQHDTTGNAAGRLLVSIVLNALITLTELVGGILSNSLALVSDAIHNLSDTLALVLARVANRVGERRPDARRTYGYKRFEIISAFFNVTALTAISFYLIYAAVLRFLHPEPVRSGLMLIIAIAGLAANLVSMLFLHRDAKKSLNIRAAYLHLLGDTLSSVAVICGAILIRYTDYTWIDPLLTMVISAVIIYQAFGILRESVSILMQSTPRNIDLAEVKAIIEKKAGIRNVHHVHCWQMQDFEILFEAHIETSEDLRLSESNRMICELETLLKDRFGITHCTLQFEYESCGDRAMIKQPG